MNARCKKATVGLVSLLLVLAVFPDARARKPRNGRLVIESMTDGARVYIDGKYKGKTPIKKPISLRPGKHKLKSTKTGYSTLELTFKIRSRRKTNVEVDLLPFSGLVKFTCNVKQAEVYVDNKMLGHTPLIRDVVVGKRKVMIVKDGYNDFVTDITVRPGEKHFVEGVLTPFRDLSPEVMAVAAEEKQKAIQAEKDRKLQADLANISKTETIQPAAPWYTDWYKQWWVWAIAGAVVVTAVSVPVALTSGGVQPGLHDHTPAIDPVQLR